MNNVKINRNKCYFVSGMIYKHLLSETYGYKDVEFIYTDENINEREQYEILNILKRYTDWDVTVEKKSNDYIFIFHRPKFSGYATHRLTDNYY